MEETATTAEPLDIERTIAEAVECQRNNRLSEAAALYERVFAIEPDHPAALHYSGILAHQQGRLDEAIGLLERSLSRDGRQPNCYSNLAIVLHARGRLEEAIDACRRAIDLDPEHANAHSNLGALLKQTGRLEEAEASYRRAIELDPEHAGAYQNLGILLGAQGKFREAVTCYCRMITLSPRHPDARRLLALAHINLGEVDKAASIYEQWLSEEPDNPVAQHMVAACTGRDVPARASDVVVTALFDGFADSFDVRLAHLGYRAPALVTEMLLDGGVEAATLDVLDAGCGTGLCGPLLAPCASRLVGVDLSSRMLVQARQRGVYHELVQSELTAYLGAHPAAFDAIVSADTLVYFGPLEDVMVAASAALKPGGRLVFTVEALREEQAPEGYLLEPHGRYGHTRPYVEGVLRRAGLDAEIVPADLRLEGGAPVAGLVVRGTKGFAGMRADA